MVLENYSVMFGGIVDNTNRRERKEMAGAFCKNNKKNKKKQNNKQTKKTKKTKQTTTQ